MLRIRRVFRIMGLTACISMLFVCSATVSLAKTKGEINASVNATLRHFRQQVRGANEYLAAAKGVLIMPHVTKAGFVIGGQYGQGALRTGGSTVGYYSLTGGSIGYQIGAESYNMVIIFFTDEALRKFRSSKGWEAGVDAEVTLIKTGAEASVETLRSQHPVVGFVFGQKGLMAGVSIKGAKFTKIHPE